MNAPRSNKKITTTLVLAATLACAGRQVVVKAGQGEPIERRQQIFVLPDGYRGPVMVIYDQPDGARPKTINGEISYEVPSDGIVRTAFPEEVLAGSTVKFMFRSSPALLQYHTCTQMRLEGLAGDPTAVCWLAVQVGGVGVADHAVYIVTDWAGIPQNYNRGAQMLDSLFFGGPGLSKFIWREPIAQAPQKSA